MPLKPTIEIALGMVLHALKDDNDWIKQGGEVDATLSNRNLLIDELTKALDEIEANRESDRIRLESKSEHEQLEIYLHRRLEREGNDGKKS